MTGLIRHLLNGAATLVLLAATGCVGDPGMPDYQFQTELGQVRADTHGQGSNPATTDLSGSYTGMGRVVRDPGGTCSVNEPVTNFHVSGDQVNYGEFHGTIRSNGSVEMVYGKTWVVGQFNGPHFIGRYIAPMCSYQIAMNRTG